MHHIKLQTEMTIRACALPFMIAVICLSLLQHGVVSTHVRGDIRLPSEQHDLKSDIEKLNGVNHITDEEIASNSRPLIGILSQPGDGMKWSVTGRRMKEPLAFVYEESYIAASYIKFVESGGARVVPLIYNEPEEVLKKKFASINGILFPGGGNSLGADSPFFLTARKLFNWAIEANDNGDYFPVYGVCLGFELLGILVSQNHNIMEPFQAQNSPGPLLFVDDLAKNRSFFQGISPTMIDKIETQNLAMQNHEWGFSPELWKSTKLLGEFFQILTVTPDQNGKLYVSTVEARKYPILGVQWHPEKNAFEWGLASIPHSTDAVKLTQLVADYFISEARKSKHKPTSHSDEESFLIYNYDPVYTSKDGKGTFDQAYVFNKTTP